MSTIESLPYSAVWSSQYRALQLRHSENIQVLESVDLVYVCVCVHVLIVVCLHSMRTKKKEYDALGLF